MADLAVTLGMPLDEWQEQALEAAMGERSDGRWASKFIGLSVPRQNGKSQIIVARALAGVLLFGEKVIIISAHETDTAREVWRRLIDVIEDNPTLEARVTARMNAVNRESLTFGEGFEKQIVKLKARSQTGSRGFSADCLLLDEAQILGKRAWGSIVPTMSARPNPQAWLFGTPPTEHDDPFAFSRVRESAVAGKARHCWLEWSADPGDDIDDPATWAKANPSFGVRISEEACADDRAAMDDGQFAMERLGMWAPPDANQFLPGWSALSESAEPPRVTAVGVAVSLDEAWGSIAAGGLWPDQRAHVGAVDRRPGSGWLPAEAKRIQDAYGCAVVVDEKCPDATLRAALEEAGVRVTVASLADYIEACSDLRNRVRDGRVTHQGRELDDAVAAASWRMVGDRRVVGRRQSSADVSMLEAAVMALHGLTSDLNYDLMNSFH